MIILKKNNDSFKKRKKMKKRKVIQFYTKGDLSLVLCDDGAIFDFQTIFNKEGKSEIQWRRRLELELVPQD